MTQQAEFGRRLANARRLRDLTRGQVAVEIGVHVSHYGHVERGEKRVSLMVFARLQELLGFDGNALIDALQVEVGPVVRRVRKPGLARRLERSPGFAGMLIAAREDAELTQAGLARAVGCSRRQLARFESGAVLPSLLRFAKLWRVLGFDVDALLAQLRDDVPREPFYGFGHLVAAAREQRSLSRVQVAQSARCELDEYEAIERGAVLPTMGAAVRIHAVVEFDADAAMRWMWRSGAIAKVA